MLDPATIANFSHVIADDDSDAFLGIHLNRPGSMIVPFRSSWQPFEVRHVLSDAKFTESSRISFYDYSGLTSGIIDLEKQRVLWHKTVSQTSDLMVIWRGDRDGEVVYQQKRKVVTADIETGEILREETVEGRLNAAGPGWKLREYRGYMFLKSGGKEFRFRSKNGIRATRMFSGLLTIVESQGPLWVLDLAEMRTVFKAMPEPGSQFCNACLATDGSMVLTQHFFDEPMITRVRYYEDLSTGQWSASQIDLSGEYAIPRGGWEIAYATRKRYIPQTGEFIGTF